MTILQALKGWLAPASTIPEAWRNMPLKDVPWLAIDLELTSLDASISNILSIGWVEGKGNQIPLGSCYYKVISTGASLNQSPVIHGLVAEDIVNGEPVRQSLESLAPFAKTHIWVFHCTNLDMGVLSRIFTKLGIKIDTLVTVDTLRLALYQLKKHHDIPAPNAATLTSCRQRHNLPLAPAHNALDDALATLELLFAQLHQYDATGNEPLSALTNTGALQVFSLETPTQ